MISIITTINNALNRVVWGPFGIALLLSAGVLLTVVNRGFQFVHIGLWLKNTIGVISLSPLVGRITKNYLDRELHGKELEPLLSATKENAPD